VRSPKKNQGREGGGSSNREWGGPVLMVEGRKMENVSNLPSKCRREKRGRF